MLIIEYCVTKTTVYVVLPSTFTISSWNEGTVIVNQLCLSYAKLLWPFLMWVLDAADLSEAECVSMLLDVLSPRVNKQNTKRLLKATLPSLSLVIWHHFN